RLHDPISWLRISGSLLRAPTSAGRRAREKVSNIRLPELLEASSARKYRLGRVSSVVEQRFCKPLDGRSDVSAGTNEINNLAQICPRPHVAYVARFSQMFSMGANR